MLKAIFLSLLLAAAGVAQAGEGFVDTVSQEITVGEALNISGASGSLMGFKIKLGETNSTQDIGVVEAASGTIKNVTQKIDVKKATNIGGKQRIGVVKAG